MAPKCACRALLVIVQEAALELLEGIVRIHRCIFKYNFLQTQHSHSLRFGKQLYFRDRFHHDSMLHSPSFDETYDEALDWSQRALTDIQGSQQTLADTVNAIAIQHNI